MSTWIKKTQVNSGKLLNARKYLEFITAVYDSSRQYRNIKLPIDKNNSLYIYG